MSDLSNTIYGYYVKHFQELPVDKQFHFASRLYLWQGDETCDRLLHTLRPWFTHNESPEAALRELITEASATTVHGSKNATELRRPYFEQYPLLKTYLVVLFRITFLKTIYNIDARPLFHDFFPQAEVEAYADRLLKDDDALRILSTHAINFLYLYYGIIKQDLGTLPQQRFLDLGRSGYDLQNPIHLQLLIYLYTHCIIGESQFYSQSIPDERLSICQTMVKELENAIASQLANINLDNKFEFLVCARLAGLESTLSKQILAESAQSLSPEGDFLIDRHNQNPQFENATLDKSEHRNVLFIMTSHDFRPRQSTIH